MHSVLFLRHAAGRSVLAMVSLLMLFFLVVQPAFAEGSKDLCENDGYRPYTERYGMETAGQARDQIITVYLKAGETIHFGSSVSNAELGWTNDSLGTTFSSGELKKLNSTDILVTTPSWNAATNPHSRPYVGGVRDNTVLLYDTTDAAVETTEGFIANAAREAAGPNLGSATNGYNAYGLTATETGFYRFKFYSAKHNIVNPTPVTTDGKWDQKGSCVAAWDTTVTDAGGAVVEGRTFTTELFLNMGGNATSSKPIALNSVMYAVTDDGYQYKVDFNGMDPYGFVFYANNRGMLNGLEGTADAFSLYHSVKSQNNQLSDLVNHGIILNNAPSDPALDKTYNLFFNTPDVDALAALSIPANPSTGDTGISNLEFHGSVDLNTDEGYAGKGGTFTFDAADGINASSFQIDLDFTDIGGGTVTLSNALKKGATNTISWDGKDANGNVVPAGTYGSDNMSMKLKGGEIHFPLMDVENNSNGIKVQRLNGLNPDSMVYYNNSGSNIGDTTTPWTVNNWSVANHLDKTMGEDSTDGAMKYSKKPSDKAGDQTALDLWANYSTPVSLDAFEFELVGATFEVTKTWSPDTPAALKNAVNVQLYNNRNEAVYVPVELNAGNSWTATFDDLWVDEGRSYYVRELKADGTPVSEGGSNTGFTVTYGSVLTDTTPTSGVKISQEITNTYTPTKVTVKKVWDSEDDPAAPTSLLVTLSADGVQVDTHTLTAGEGWTYTFTDLDPLKTYTVAETTPFGYTGKVSPLTGNAKDGYSCTLVNTFDEGAFASVGVMKEWADVPEGLQPTQVEVTLRWGDTHPNGVAQGDPVKVGGDNGNAIDPVAVLSAANSWSHVWTLLDTRYTYELTETINGKEPAKVGYDAGDTCTLENMPGSKYFYADIVNTYQPTAYTVSKTWDNGLAGDEAQPTQATVVLQQSKADGPFVDYGAPVVLNEGNDWKYAWSDLPSYDEEGNAFAYRTQEDPVAGYVTTYGDIEGDVDSAMSQEITNTYKYTALTVNKTWDYGTQLVDDRPGSATVQLLANDVEIYCTALTEANGWTYTFDDLPAFENDGVTPVVYTVSEDEISDYVTTGGVVSGDVASGYSAAFTNTYDGPDPTTSTTTPTTSTSSTTTSTSTTSTTTQTTSTTTTSTASTGTTSSTTTGSSSNSTSTSSQNTNTTSSGDGSSSDTSSTVVVASAGGSAGTPTPATTASAATSAKTGDALLPVSIAVTGAALCAIAVLLLSRRRTRDDS